MRSILKDFTAYKRKYLDNKSFTIISQDHSATLAMLRSQYSIIKYKYNNINIISRGKNFPWIWNIVYDGQVLSPV